ncbi:hypothetical protein [Kibdelosporangium philippinense]|uniref:hypothetical protein n=1 Tax=Kibdelosporangium philippinense TaxID=211113 RepID=UPI003617AB66
MVTILQFRPQHPAFQRPDMVHHPHSVRIKANPARPMTGLYASEFPLNRARDFTTASHA